MGIKLSIPARERIQKQLHFLEKRDYPLTIDADVHITDTKAMPEHFIKQLQENPDYFHGRPVSAEELLREMKMAGVDMALVWQNPAATLYSDKEEENYDALYRANRYIFECSMQWPDKFIPAGWTDPRALGIPLAKKLAKICVEEFGFAVVKMNPAQNAFPIDSDIVIEVFEEIVQMKAVPAFHFGADTGFTPPKGLVKLAQRHPEHPIIGVHMGGGGASYPGAENHYIQARKAGLENPNIRFILSAKRDTHIESDLITYTLAGKPFCNNLFCASDAPYGRMSWNFGGYREMFRSMVGNVNHTDPRVNKNNKLFSDEIVKGYLGNNLAFFIVEAYRKLLEN